MMTYEFIHPAQCMNSYVSDPCLVYKKMATDGGGGGMGGVTMLRTPYWSLVQIPKTWMQFFLANYLPNFHVAAILAISTYIKPNI